MILLMLHFLWLLSYKLKGRTRLFDCFRVDPPCLTTPSSKNFQHYFTNHHTQYSFERLVIVAIVVLSLHVFFLEITQSMTLEDVRKLWQISQFPPIFRVIKWRRGLEAALQHRAVCLRGLEQPLFLKQAVAGRNIYFQKKFYNQKINQNPCF